MKKLKLLIQILYVTVTIGLILSILFWDNIFAVRIWFYCYIGAIVIDNLVERYLIPNLNKDTDA